MVRDQHKADLAKAKKELPIIGGWRYNKIKQYANTAYDRGFKKEAELFIINCWRHIKYKNYHGCDEVIHNFYRFVLEGTL